MLRKLSSLFCAAALSFAVVGCDKVDQPAPAPAPAPATEAAEASGMNEADLPPAEPTATEGATEAPAGDTPAPEATSEGTSAEAK